MFRDDQRQPSVARSLLEDTGRSTYQPQVQPRSSFNTEYFCVKKVPILNFVR